MMVLQLEQCLSERRRQYISQRIFLVWFVKRNHSHPLVYRTKQFFRASVDCCHAVSSQYFRLAAEFTVSDLMLQAIVFQLS